jgi:hypothetical protein
MFRLLARGWMFLAGAGLALSAVAHAAALLGLDLPNQVLGLHVGVLVVGVPALLAARAVHPGRHTAWRRTGLFVGRPWWLQGVIVGLLVYATVNCYLALSGLLEDFGGLSVQNGPVPAAVVRVFSGFWLFLYAVEVSAFYPEAHPLSEAEPAAHRCPFGHVVPAGAELCPRCEWRVERE